MKQELYEYYTTIFGHTYILNEFVNMFSNESIEMADSVDIGRNTQIRGNVILNRDVILYPNVWMSGDINIGEHTSVHGNNSIIGDVNIGKFSVIARRARIRTLDHPTHRPGMQMSFHHELGIDSQNISKGPVDIGHDVWVCSDAKILSDVTIGNGAIVAANSVVVDDVEPYSIVAGNPATHKKYRFDQDTISSLQEIAWWDWSEEKQKQNKEFFRTNLRDIADIRSLIN